MKENFKYGWIGLYRSIKDHWLYPSGKFTRYEAWIDILLMVNHTDKKVFNGADMEICKIGETFTSQIKLMKRWGWSKSKVLGFLEVLKKDRMIDLKTSSKKTTIKVINYIDYQSFNSIKENKKDRKKTAKDTTKRLQKDTNKNVNKEKNIYIPKKSEFMLYAKSKIPFDYDSKRKNLSLKYESWIENGWKDGFNKPIENWKSKLLNNLQYIKKDFKNTNRL